MMMALIDEIIYAVLAVYAFGSVLYFRGARTGQKKVFQAAFIMAITGVVLNLLVLIIRTIIAGRLPLSNGAEFLLLFTWITVVFYLILQKKIQYKGAGGLVLLMAALLILAGAVLMKEQFGTAMPLMPALKSPWLCVHVLTAALAYAGFALAAGLALWCVWGKSQAIGNSIIYSIVASGFAMLSLSIVFGAIWAEQAWGTYWSWDPKETWALVTWIIYALYLHLHKKMESQERQASIMVIAGFVFVLFTFFGVNYLLPGLHSYGVVLNNLNLFG